MSDPKYHWLVSGQVITTDAQGVERQKNMNVLLHTEEPHVGHKDIGRSQQAMQMRFVTQCPQIKGAKITDCFIFGISPLGLMTTEQFLDQPSVAADPAQKSLELN